MPLLTTADNYLRQNLFDNIEQLNSYLARLGVNSGWLVIFDACSQALPMLERLNTQVLTKETGRSVTVVRA